MGDKFRHYTPFLERKRAKNIDGKYRNKNTGSTIILKNMFLTGLICGETEKPYDAYVGHVKVVGDWEDTDCIVDIDTYNELEKIE